MFLNIGIARRIYVGGLYILLYKLKIYIYISTTLKAFDQKKNNNSWGIKGGNLVISESLINNNSGLLSLSSAGSKNFYFFFSFFNFPCQVGEEIKKQKIKIKMIIA